MTTEKINKRKMFIQQYLLYLVPVIIFLVIVSIYLYHQDRNEEVALLRDEETTGLKLKEDFIEHEMEIVEADIKVLTSLDELIEYYDSPTQKKLNKLKLAFLTFSQQKALYEQIRIIDLKGKEVLRIENKKGHIIVIDDLQLQDKSDRYYYQETMKLGKGEIYISKLDLNIEDGKIEIPYAPTIRFGMNFFMKNSKKCLVVLNFNAVSFLENIGKTYLDETGEQMLLNKEGYWLLSNNKKEEWGFMFEDKKDVKFQNKFPLIWSVISENENGCIEDDHGIFTYRTIYFARYRGVNVISTSDQTPDLIWKLVSYISYSKLNEYLYPLLINRIIIGGLLLLGAMFAIAFIANLRVKNKIAQIKINENVDYLTERDKIKNKFMAIFSHDLKNSIGALNNYAEMLKEDYYEMDDDERLRFITNMEDISNNTMNLLLTLLEWARSYITSIEDTRHMINLGDIANNNVELLRHEADSKRISLSSSIDYGTEVFGDENVVNALFRNFVYNSIKFTNTGGYIKLYTRNGNGEKTYIVIEDNGVGMTRDQIEKVLDPNGKYTTKGTNKEGGSGMGLKLCKELIEKYGGELIIESQPGEGSKFCFHLGD